MTLEQVSYLAQIIGGVVVIATLIYLSIQVRQGTEALRSDTRQAAMNNDASMRVREYEWMQFRSGVLDEATWLTYRGVIFFVLGTQRARALWSLTAQYFNASSRW